MMSAEAIEKRRTGYLYRKRHGRPKAEPVDTRFIPSNPDDMLTLVEAAALLRHSVYRVRKWAVDGYTPQGRPFPAHKVETKWLIQRKYVDALLGGDDPTGMSPTFN